MSHRGERGIQCAALAFGQGVHERDGARNKGNHDQELQLGSRRVSRLWRLCRQFNPEKGVYRGCSDTGAWTVRGAAAEGEGSSEDIS